MVNRTVAAFVAAAFLGLQVLPSAAYADNQMGYKLLTADQAEALPSAGGKLGLNVGRAQQISSSGITFELLKVNSVVAGSPGAKAGFKVGDQIIAVDGRVFSSVAAFAAYVGSNPPGRELAVDTMPPNGGPQDAQRISVTLGGATRATTTTPSPAAPESKGLSTGTKIAIGVGAAALFGCYKFGCFSHKAKPGMQGQPAAQ